MSVRRGLFVTFEGGEGAGKTTLVKAISRHLEQRGLPVLLTRAPGGTPLGHTIRDLLLHGQDLEITPQAELYLFLADRAQHVIKMILPALEEGQIVLCDRFNDSTIAYQGCGRGLSEESVAAACLAACQGLQPDCTFYLDLPCKMGMERVKKERSGDRIEEEGLSFHEKIREAFLRIANGNPQRVIVLDASRPAEYVEQQALEKLDALLAAHR